MRKTISILTIFTIILTLVACGLQEPMFKVEPKNNNAVVLNEGEDIDFSLFNLNFYGEDGASEMLTTEAQYKNITHNYIKNPSFDHKNKNDKSSIQNVVFEYKGLKSAVIKFTTMRKEVTRLSIATYGKTNYQYGQEFNFNDFSINATFANGSAKTIELTLDMIDLGNDNSLVKPEAIGLVNFDVWYNGVKTNLNLTVNKGEQTLEEELSVVRFDDKEIEVNSISGAEYAFVKGNEEKIWQENNIFISSNLITDDYKVYARLKETEFYSTSNEITVNANYNPKIVGVSVVEITDKEIQVESIRGFELFIIDELNNIVRKILNPYEGIYYVDNLAPNTTYRLSYRQEGSDEFYSGNTIEVKTLLAPKNYFTFTEEQTVTYNGVANEFNYTVDHEYRLDEHEITIIYLKDSLEVENPIDVGVYDVIITTNFNNHVYEGSLTIVKKEITVEVGNYIKEYNDNDPIFEITVNNPEDFINDDLVFFNIEFSREEGELIGDYLIEANVSHDNYNIIVVNGLLTINKKLITAVVNDIIMEYGTKPPTPSYEFLNNFTPEFVSGHENKEFNVTYNVLNDYKTAGQYENVITAVITNNYYEVEVVYGNLTINKTEVEIFIDSKEAYYGEEAKELTYTLSLPFYDEELNIELVMNKRNVGEHIIDVNYNKLNDNNFELTINKGTYTILPIEISIAIDPKQIAYGYSVDELQSQLSWSKTEGVFGYGDQNRDFNTIFEIYHNGEKVSGQTILDIGTYVVKAEVVNGNYVISEIEDSVLVIDKRAITVIPNEETYEKIYGQEDKDLYSYTVTSGINLNGKLSRQQGEDVGYYTINVGNLVEKNPNYDITFISKEFARLQIKPFRVNLEMDLNSLTKVYKESDPIFSFTHSNLAIDGEELFGNIVREAGEDVGSYNFIIDQLVNLNPNYDIRLNQKTFTITKANISVNLINDLTKTYGEVDPLITYELDDNNFKDELNIVFTREIGEDVGDYEITIASYNNANINITNVNDISGSLAILKREITLNYDGQTEIIYGNQIDVIVLTEDQLAGTEELRYSKENVNVGVYEVEVKVFDDLKDVTNNYQITNNSFTYEVIKKDIDVVIDNKTANVGNTSNILFTVTINSNDFEFNDNKDTLNITNNDFLVDTEHNLADLPIGQYDILFNSNYSSNNYNLNIVQTGILVVESLPIDYSFDEEKLTHVYDGNDYTLSSDDFIFTNPEQGDEVIDLSEFLTINYYQNGNKVTPHDAGKYEVKLIILGSGEYDLTIYLGVLEIKKIKVNLTINDLEKIYGEADPDITYDLSNNEIADDLVITFAREIGETIGTYEISIEGYQSKNIELIDIEVGTLTINKKEITLIYSELSVVYNGSLQEVTASSDKALVGNDKLVLNNNKHTNVGIYLIEATINDNYLITNDEVYFEIVKANIALTIDDLEITYLDDEPVLSYSFDKEYLEDKVMVNLVRELGNNVGTYEIALVNYDQTNVTITNELEKGYLTIIPKEITLRYIGLNRTYDKTLKVVSVEITNFDESLFDGEITLSNNEKINAGIYTVTAEVNSNYIITNDEAIFTIAKAEVEARWVNEAEGYGIKYVATATYGQNTIIELNIFNNEQKTKGTHEAYAEIKNEEDINNYILINDIKIYEVEKNYINIEVNPQSYVYNGNQRNFSINFAGNQNYIIDDIRYNNSSNVPRNVGVYEVSFIVNHKENEEEEYYPLLVETTLTITPKEIIITPNEGATKVYGSNDPSFEFLVEGLLPGDNLSGSLTRTLGEEVGSYQITIGTLSAGSNYSITLINEVFEITLRELAVDVIGSYGYTGLQQSVELEYNLVNDDNFVVYVEQIKDVDTYTLTLKVKDDLDNRSNNYIIPENITVTLEKISVNLTSKYDSDDDILINSSSVEVFSILYTNNELKLENVLDIFNLNDGDAIKADYSFVYTINGVVGNSIDLSNGATTFIITIEANSVTDNVDSFTKTIIVKYKSVLINNQYYTIEDALYYSGFSDKIIVKYNTIFSSQYVRNLIYTNESYFTLQEDVHLIIPDSETDESTQPSEKDLGYGNTGVEHNPGEPFVRFIIPENITLIAEKYSNIYVNAIRGSASTKYQGFVNGSDYSEVRIDEGSKIVVGGTITILGFVYGEGEIEVLDKAKAYEAMLIKDFRGGTVTSRVYQDAFPFYEFSLANNEVRTTYYQGSSLTALPLIYAGSSYVTAEINLLSPHGSDFLLKTVNATIIKDYQSGKVTMTVDGDIEINNISLEIAGFLVKSEGIELGFDGSWQIDIKSGSNVTINAWISLLPGAVINIEEGATVITALISEENEYGSRILVYNPYELLDERKDTYFSNNGKEHYRVAPTISYDKKTPAELNVYGNLIIQGQIAGKINVYSTGVLNLDQATETYFESYYVIGSGNSSYAATRPVELFIDESYLIQIVADNPIVQDNSSTVITVTVYDKNNNPVSGVEVDFDFLSEEFIGELSLNSAITNSEGQVTVVYNVDKIPVKTYEKIKVSIASYNYESYIGLYVE